MVCWFSLCRFSVFHFVFFGPPWRYTRHTHLVTCRECVPRPIDQRSFGQLAFLVWWFGGLLVFPLSFFSVPFFFFGPPWRYTRHTHLVTCRECVPRPMDQRSFGQLAFLVWWFGGLSVCWLCWWFGGVPVCRFAVLVVWWFAGLLGQPMPHPLGGGRDLQCGKQGRQKNPPKIPELLQTPFRRFAGLMVCCFGGLLVCWFAGLLVWWFAGLGGLLVCWFCGLVVSREGKED